VRINQGQAGASSEIEVTPEMTAAGISALHEHRYGDDADYTVECVYRAMAYALARASATSLPK
jgi:hypothetical protein